MRLINPPVFQTRCRCSKLSWGRIWWIGLVGLALGSFDGRAAAPLRELETDRPDATESPVTVDRGHFQLESSFFSFSRDDSAGVRTETWGVAESNIKYLSLIHI